MLTAALLIAQTTFERTTVGGGFLFAILCAVLAPGRGRSALAWFFLGLFFSCIALIFLLLLPDLTVQDKIQEGTARELHRLRERAKKERQVADERHDSHNARLEAHDRALGMDTVDEPPQVAGPPPPLPAPLPDGQEAMWFFLDQGDQLGPVPTSELRQMLQDARINRTALVWREGMVEWMPYGDLPELS